MHLRNFLDTGKIFIKYYSIAFPILPGVAGGLALELILIFTHHKSYLHCHPEDIFSTVIPRIFSPLSSRGAQRRGISYHLPLLPAVFPTADSSLRSEWRGNDVRNDAEMTFGITREWRSEWRGNDIRNDAGMTFGIALEEGLCQERVPRRHLLETALFSRFPSVSSVVKKWWRRK
jgi:hypothetical protein